VVRVTCTSSGGATRVQIHQDDHMDPLIVDLAALNRALAATSGAPGRNQHDQGMGDRHDRDGTSPNPWPVVAAASSAGPAGEELER
jgi:hypothetical protein